MGRAVLLDMTLALNPDIDEIEIEGAAGHYVARAVHRQVRMTFDQIEESRGGIRAELQVHVNGAEVLPTTDIGLKSDSGQTKLAASLKGIAPEIPWKLLLQRACSRVLKRHRMGEPPIHLNKESRIDPLTFSVNPLVFSKKPTILFGEGGIGKSSLALLCAMLVSTGKTVGGISGLKGNALYLDYEDSDDVHRRRLHAILAGHPELDAVDVVYERCTHPLTKLVHPLTRLIQEKQITFVVLDSLMAATGGDSSAEGTAQLFAALRLFHCDILALGHQPKTQGEGQPNATIYGSVFFHNFARSVWEMKKEQDVGEDVSILGLFNRKSNLSRLHLPIGLQVTQNADSTEIHYELADLTQTADLAIALPLASRIRNFLEDGNPRSSKEIADALEAKWASVKVTLSKHRGRKWQLVDEHTAPKWAVLHG